VQLGLPEGTVKSRINRGRLELARQIARIHEHEVPRPKLDDLPRAARAAVRPEKANEVLD